VPELTAPLDVVMLYAPPWAGPTRFSKHHLATWFAERGNRVLYVEAPLTPLGVRRGRAFTGDLRATLRTPRAVHHRLWVRRHFVPVPYHAVSPITSTRLANRLAQRWLAPAIRRDLERLGMRRPVLVAGLPHAVDVVPWLPRQTLVYHCADDYAHVKGFPRSLPDLEADLCRQADLVITTSQTLCKTRRQYNPNTHWVPNGADVEHFSSPATPAPELQTSRRPIVGFVGGLSQWVDVRLVGDLVRARPDWSFVLIGPVSVDVSPLRGLANLRLLGPRAYDELPSYLAAMDVGLIPFRQDPVTFHADPIKAYEYLAAGLPVVATDLPALRRLGHVVRLADSAACFREQIEAPPAHAPPPRAADPPPEAARHSWTSRFEIVDGLIRESLSGDAQQCGAEPLREQPSAAGNRERECAS
jgi:glycosyltransferase involved in cell wall biosynthesis